MKARSLHPPHSPPTVQQQRDEEIEIFLCAQEESGIRCIASHDTYLINPASEKEDILAKSRAALIDEVQRSARLRIPYVVMHQGAILAQGTPDQIRNNDEVAMILLGSSGPDAFTRKD